VQHWMAGRLLKWTGILVYMDGSSCNLVWGTITALAWWDTGNKEIHEKSVRIVTVPANIQTRHPPLEPMCSVVNSKHAIIWKEECCLSNITSLYLFRVIE
jgi:hypothetical protein